MTEAREVVFELDGLELIVPKFTMRLHNGERGGYAFDTIGMLRDLQRQAEATELAMRRNADHAGREIENRADTLEQLAKKCDTELQRIDNECYVRALDFHLPEWIAEVDDGSAFGPNVGDLIRVLELYHTELESALNDGTQPCDENGKLIPEQYTAYRNGELCLKAVGDATLAERDDARGLTR